MAPMFTAPARCAMMRAPSNDKGVPLMASQGSVKVVLAALLGNSVIAVIKFTAAAITGSSAML